MNTDPGVNKVPHNFPWFFGRHNATSTEQCEMINYVKVANIWFQLMCRSTATVSLYVEAISRPTDLFGLGLLYLRQVSQQRTISSKILMHSSTLFQH